MLYSAFKLYILDSSLICTCKILDIRASRSFSKILSTSYIKRIKIKKAAGKRSSR